VVVESSDQQKKSCVEPGSGGRTNKMLWFKNYHPFLYAPEFALPFLQLSHWGQAIIN
jgi:hypothetical protein